MIRTAPSDHRGFTLIELLVVLVLLGSITALSLPLLARPVPASVTLSIAAGELADGLRRTRQAAMLRSRSVTFTLDLATRQYWSAIDQRRRSLDSQLAISTRAARQPLRVNRAVFRFYPDGTSSGGTIALALGQAGEQIVVDWLTGRVSRSDG